MKKYLAFCLLFAALLFVLESYKEPSVQKKKVLVLIIASDNHPAFHQLQQIWRGYMNSHPEVDAYFIKGDPDIKDSFEIRDHTLFTKVKDDYRPGIINKTVLSLEALASKLSNYDFVVRTNLSSFYDFNHLVAFLDEMPKKNLYAGTMMYPSFDLPKSFLLKNGKTPFAWGAGFILSVDLAKELVKNKDELLIDSAIIPDDVLVGLFFNKREIPIINTICYDFLSYQNWTDYKDYLIEEELPFHYRAKSKYTNRTLQDPYDEELKVLTELFMTTYPDLPLEIAIETDYPLNLDLKTAHLFESARSSDIHEHLPLLKNLASECGSMIELGFKNKPEATWSLLQGLSENKEPNKTYQARDTYTKNSSATAEEILLADKLARENKIVFGYFKDRVGEKPKNLQPSDLLFIDSLHTYAHASYELETYSPVIKKYIVLHDTSEPWGYRNDTSYRGNYKEYSAGLDLKKKGVWPAVEDFLIRHPEWKLKERLINNHGLTILERAI